jgi:hypothetical protein
LGDREAVMTSAENGERIASLEAHIVGLEDRLDDQDEDLRSIRNDVREIRDVLTQYKGFAGGVIATVSVLSGFIGALAVFVWHKLTSSP